MLVKASDLTSGLAAGLKKLEEDVDKESVYEDVYDLAKYNRDVIFEDMDKLREVVDELETRVPKEIWPYPTYGEILYSVR